MKLQDIFEKADSDMMIPDFSSTGTLFYGCCRGEAQQLLSRGFSGSSGLGSSRIALFADAEDARNYVEKKRKCETVLRVKNIPISILDILSGNPEDNRNKVAALRRAKRGEHVVFTTSRPIPQHHFEIYK